MAATFPCDPEQLLRSIAEYIAHTTKKPFSFHGNTRLSPELIHFNPAGAGEWKWGLVLLIDVKLYTALASDLYSAANTKILEASILVAAKAFISAHKNHSIASVRFAPLMVEPQKPENPPSPKEAVSKVPQGRVIPAPGATPNDPPPYPIPVKSEVRRPPNALPSDGSPYADRQPPNLPWIAPKAKTPPRAPAAKRKRAQTPTTNTDMKEKSMGPKTRTASILFMDVSGWSKLKATDIYNYVTKAMPELTKQISGHDFINTWGDAIVATFGSAKDAAESALNVRDFFTKAHSIHGVADGLTSRISLHTGEVILCENPLKGGEDIFGDAVHMAARLEPATAPGYVFCTEGFAALLRGVAGLGPKAWPLPGKLQLPKGYGEIDAAVVTWNGERDPLPGLAEFLGPKPAPGAPAVPAASADDRSYGDARVKLRGWLGRLPVSRSMVANSYSNVDLELEISAGSTKLLLPAIVAMQAAENVHAGSWSIEEAGDTMFALRYHHGSPQPNPRSSPFGK